MGFSIRFSVMGNPIEVDRVYRADPGGFTQISPIGVNNTKDSDFEMGNFHTKAVPAYDCSLPTKWGVNQSWVFQSTLWYRWSSTALKLRMSGAGSCCCLDGESCHIGRNTKPHSWGLLHEMHASDEHYVTYLRTGFLTLAYWCKLCVQLLTENSEAKGVAEARGPWWYSADWGSLNPGDDVRVYVWRFL